MARDGSRAGRLDLRAARDGCNARRLQIQTPRIARHAHRLDLQTPRAGRRMGRFDLRMARELGRGAEKRQKMISLGSISRENAALRFDFLAARFPSRRAAIRDFTHRDPDFVFWIFPDGRLFDARNSHLKNPPPGFAHILKDEPDYGGFLRGRVASFLDDQLTVVYCRPLALAQSGPKLTQFLAGIEQLPILLRDDALIISDNGDLYGTFCDLLEREGENAG